MLFSSTVFVLLFAPITIGLYYATARSRRVRLGVLCIASLVFYGYWDVRLIPLLVGSAAGNWLLIQVFARNRRNAIVYWGIAFNLVLIGIFKYADFFAENLLPLLGQEHRSFDIVLPLGISFFTFQQISYLADLSRGEKHIYGFRDYFLFVTFFPQLIAGPIVRHNEIIGQFGINPRRPEMWENLSRGSILFVIGMAKKVLLADPIAHVSDPLYHSAFLGETLTFGDAWMAAAGFTLQVYFDFSAYSDMAIGMGLMCGFRLPINFNAPYRAVSIRDFWRRWHITLSRFLRDYLYFPLGGSRRGRLRQALNMVITMLLAGLWHGAGWGYVFWGGLTGIGLAANTAWVQAGLRMPALLGWTANMLFFMTTLLVFRAESVASTGPLLVSAFGGNGFAGPSGGTTLFVVAALVSIVGPTSQEVALGHLRPRLVFAVAGAAALVFLLLWIGGELESEFIYFQF